MSKTATKHPPPPPAELVPVEGEPRPAHRPFGLVDGILLLLCGGLLLLILLVAVVPRLLGCTPYAIASESMSPLLQRGDLVFVRPVAFDELVGNEIVVFQTDTGFITHRVYAIDETTRTLRTKADASLYLDAQPVKEGSLVGQVLYKLPLLGHVSLFSDGKEVGT